MPKLYITATPIGNLEDVTLRALRALKEVDIVICEDTRITNRLLDRYDIKKPTISYHSKSGLSKVNRIKELLKEGKDLALVSDAGTPGISDPGSVLVNEIRQDFPNVQIIPIPGASAVTTAISGSGLSGGDFLFLGFLPHKKGRNKMFEEIKNSKRTVVFYESPHRILKTLRSLAELLSEERELVIARELTKIHEEFIKGKADDILKMFEKGATKQKGEFVIMVEST